MTTTMTVISESISNNIMHNMNSKSHDMLFIVVDISSSSFSPISFSSFPFSLDAERRYLAKKICNNKKDIRFLPYFSP